MKKTLKVISLILVILICFTACSFNKTANNNSNDVGEVNKVPKKGLEQCERNMEIIKTTAIMYYLGTNEVPTIDDVANDLSEGHLPECPLSEDGDYTNDYDILITDIPEYKVFVACKHGHISREDMEDGVNPQVVMEAAKAEVCEKHMESILTSVYAYCFEYNKVPTIDDFASKGQKVVECPSSEDGNYTNDYEIHVDENGIATVSCKNGHTHEGSIDTKIDPQEKVCIMNLRLIYSKNYEYFEKNNAYITEDILLGWLADGSVEECPLSKDGDYTNDYSYTLHQNGSPIIMCKHGHDFDI